MRKHVLLASLSSLLLLPGASAAQQGGAQIKSAKNAGQGAGEGEAPPQPEGSSTVAPGAPAAGEGTGQPSSAHTVEKGDTLWDLSQKYLGSPWYWPKVWSYNPEIANPHWIYPGNVVRFFQGGEETPTQVEVGQQPSGEEPAGEVEESTYVPDEEEGRISVSGPIGYVPKKAIALQATGFVTPGEVEESGVIAGSFAQTEMLSPPEQFYARFRDGHPMKLGDAFVIFRSAGEVIHPITHQSVGFITKIVGAGRVVKQDKTGLAVCTIERQFDDIRRGDFLGPLGESLIHSVAARPNEREIKGAFVVSSTTPYLTMFAENQIVIIDKGADDGVKPGNIFHVWRAKDGMGMDSVLHPEMVDEAWPREDVGACMAFEVKSKATTCLVTKSLRDLVKGDNVEMRVVRARSAMR